MIIFSRANACLKFSPRQKIGTPFEAAVAHDRPRKIKKNHYPPLQTKQKKCCPPPQTHTSSRPLQTPCCASSSRKLYYLCTASERCPCLLSTAPSLRGSTMVCVLCIQPFLCTRRHPAYPVSVLTFRPREILALWSQNHDTEIIHRNAVKGVDNAMPCHRTGYDRHNIRSPATQIQHA